MQRLHHVGMLGAKGVAEPARGLEWHQRAEPLAMALSARSAQLLAASGPYQAVVSIRPSAAVRSG